MKLLNPKKIILSLLGLSIIAGSVASIVDSVINRKSNVTYVLKFVNGKNPAVNSNYRLLGMHQKGYPGDDLNKVGRGFTPWELELGVVLDNSNPAVQAEQLNWLYYLTFFKKIKEYEKNQNNSNFIASTSTEINAKNATFDGMRIDSSDGIDSDIIGQTGQLLTDLYGRHDSDANANDHLSFNEGYGPEDQINERKYFHNDSLNYDDSYHNNIENLLEWYNGDSGPSLEKAHSLMVDRNNDETENVANPNLTYTQNHDNFNTRIRDIAALIDSHFSWNDFNQKKWNDLVQASEKYYEKFAANDKTFMGRQIAPKNLISLYADMFTNKDTVPILFYGDIFEAEKDYMSTPTSIAEPIMDILAARSKYMAGGQQRRVVDKGKIITNVRFGNGYYEGKTQDSSVGKTSGIATIFSNDAKINKNIKVYVGKNHAKQYYENLIDTSNDEATGLGLTIGKAANSDSNTIMGVKNNHQKLLNNDNHIQVDDAGYLTINVKGVNKPFVNGYLSMWVPEGAAKDQNIYVNESDAQNMHTFQQTGLTLNSNAALDSHVLYQDFATVVPFQGINDQDNDSYAMLTKHAQDIANSGVTDVWMAPPYVSPNPLAKEGSKSDWVARYGYGYMMSDRYNLGDGDTPSKYGTSDQLIEATDALHRGNSKIIGRNLKTMIDFVPHQIIMGDESEEVTSDEYGFKYFGYTLHLVKKNFSRELLTKTSNFNQQSKYGGIYLETIKDTFPDMFKTPALSNGMKLSVDEKIKNWSAKYELSYALEFGFGDFNHSYDAHNDYYLPKKY